LPLIEDTRVVIYDRNMFMIQATVDISIIHNLRMLKGQFLVLKPFVPFVFVVPMD